MSDQLYGDGVSWLATGLPNKQLRSVGLVTIVWNAIEYDLQELIVALAGWSPWQGFLVTTNLANVSRLQLAFNLLHHGYKHKRLCDDVNRSLDFFDECRKRRNALVHGMPTLGDDGTLTGRLARFDSKPGKGSVKITHIHCTSAYLDEMIADVWWCRMALTDAERKVTRFRRLAPNRATDLEPEIEKDVFDYAKESLDIELLQERLDYLRSQPPTPSRYPSPH